MSIEKPRAANADLAYFRMKCPVISFFSNLSKETEQSFFSLQVGAVAKLGTDTVSGIYTFGKNRVTKAVDYGLQTPYGEFLLGQLDASLSFSEKMLDRYLPEEGGRSVIVKYKFIAHSN